MRRALLVLLLCTIGAAGCGDDDPNAVCGDGTKDTGEQCDDGNTANGDGCSSACRTESTTRCGDGTVQTGEQCDDGNTANGDGCSSTCQTEAGPDCGDGTVDAGEECDDGNTNDGDGCDSACQMEATGDCGDGAVDGGEGCDDGDTTSGDGCSATCAVEAGYECTGAPSVCTPDCGDGMMIGNEGCDDGNTSANDGCSAACAVEAGYTCTGAPSTCTTTCGDGVQAGAEACDDGNATEGDGCDSNCTASACGNGITGGTEECDDGNTADGDGCTANCETEVCGDGVRRGAEACDGTDIPTDCVGQGFIDGVIACDANCALDVTGCIGAGCGNNILEAGEVCDDGNVAGGDGCRADCLGTEVCPDSLVDVNEDCDDGNTAIGDGCDPTCHFEVCGDGLVSVGSGVSEQCDDGNTDDGDGCSATCQREAGWELEPNDTATAAASFSSLAVGDRVNGWIDPEDDVDFFLVNIPNGPAILTAETFDNAFGETCASNLLDTYITVYDAAGLAIGDDDDGGDGYCSRVALSSLAAGDYYVTVDPSPFALGGTFSYTLEVTVTVPVCGNGTQELGEQCDDGNVVVGDGCSDTCQLEGTAELEPNDTATAATALSVGVPGFAGIDPAADVDFYSFVVTGLADVRIETFDGAGPGSCVGVDTVISLFDVDGTTLLATNDDGGISACSLLDPVGYAALHNMAPGTYYVSVIDFAQNTVIPAYTLLVSYDSLCGDGVTEGAEECDGGATCAADCTRIPTCGDGFVDAPENCDDGNTTAGDGCDATCQREVVCGDGFTDGNEECDDGNTTGGDGCSATCTTEVGFFFETEPNDELGTAAGPVIVPTTIRGAINPAGDVDFYAITITTTSDLRFETFDLQPALDSCVDTDTVIYFYDGAGTLLAVDDQGGTTDGDCSLLDPIDEPAVAGLAPGTYYIAVEDFLNDDVIVGYQLLAQVVATCGDNVLEGSEECDDGNTVDDAACNANCTLPACGDGVLGNSPGETCDDGNLTNDDGCDSNCTPTGCGNGIETTGEQCDDGNLVGGDGCDPTCILEDPCGNGNIDSGETCDDGNQINGDGCSYDSTTPGCQIEPGHFFELEPNDDGATATSTNDFSSVNANGPLTETTIVHGELTPAGDDDVFAVTNLGLGPVTAVFNMYRASLGLGVSCGNTSAYDPRLDIRDAAGTVLLGNDDRSISTDWCPGISYTIAAGTTVYAHVRHTSDTTAIAPYLLQIEIPECGNGTVETGEECEPPNSATCDATCQRVPLCGDGLVDAPETCDDGNVVDGDGCSASCAIEGVNLEVEPNNSTADADARVLDVRLTTSAVVAGSITDVTDELDYFRLDVAAASVIRFETFDNGASNDCGATTTTLRLRDSAGTQIITDSTSGIAACSAMVFPFTAGTVNYIQIEDPGTNASIPSYTMEVRYHTDLGSETEPNEDLATANVLASAQNVFVSGDHSVNTDSDYFAITVPAGASVRAELIEGDRAVTTCESLGLDSRITLYDSAGTQLVDDDDDGRGFCSKIDGTGTVPADSAAHNLAAGTYYLQVRASTFAQTGTDGQFTYKLVVTVR